MSAAYFEGQRREMIAAIRVIAQHLAAEIGKTALDDRVLGAPQRRARSEFEGSIPLRFHALFAEAVFALWFLLRWVRRCHPSKVGGSATALTTGVKLPFISTPLFDWHDTASDS